MTLKSRNVSAVWGPARAYAKHHGLPWPPPRTQTVAIVEVASPPRLHTPAPAPAPTEAVQGHQIVTLYRAEVEGRVRYHVNPDTAPEGAERTVAVRDPDGRHYLLKDSAIAPSAIVAPFNGRSVAAVLQRGLDPATLTEDEREALLLFLAPRRQTIVAPPEPVAPIVVPSLRQKPVDKAPEVTPPADPLEPLYKPLLGRYPDTVVAEILGVHKTTVRDRRYRYSIGAYKRPYANSTRMAREETDRLTEACRAEWAALSHTVAPH